MVVLVAIGAGALSARGWAHFQHRSVSYYWPQSLATDPLQFWTTPDDQVHLGKSSGPDGQPAVGVQTTASRSFFTLIEHTFGSPQDWSTRRDVFLSFRGEGSGALYQLVVYTDEQHMDWVSFAFRDIQPGWRVLTFDLAKPDHAVGRPDVSHVMALRIGTSDPSVPGSLALGTIAVSQPGSR